MKSILCASLAMGSVSAVGVARQGSAHGYRSSEPWLPRVPVVTSLTGEELIDSTISTIPDAFDWRDVDGRSWVTIDLNQHVPKYCGACWIHGTVHALNDRIKMLRKGAFPDIILSRQALINCVPDGSGGPNPGCNGGDAWMIHKYMHEKKVPDDSCLAYESENQECVEENICRNCFHNMTIEPDGHPFFTPGPCFGVKHFTGYRVGDYGRLKGETAMKKEIFARGPIACSFASDDTLVYNYSTNPGVLKEGVYTTDVQYTAEQVDHVMEVTGWGETLSGTKYWVVRNSWGTYWGDMGWLKIQRGVNQMMVEKAGCDWAIPTFDDVDEQLHSRVLGSYMDGVTWKPLSGEKESVTTPPSSSSDVQALSLASTLVGGRDVSLATLLTAVAVVTGALGVLVGSFATSLVVKRANPVQDQSLLG